jgi:hypothetical protein
LEKKLVCPCGLTCCDCLFYKNEIYFAARTLQGLIYEHKLDRFLSGCSHDSSRKALEEHLNIGIEQARDELGPNEKRLRLCD